MSAILKRLVAVGIIVSCSSMAMAEEVGANNLSRREQTERMKNMTPEQRLQERRTMHEAMLKLTPEERKAKRKEMRAEFDKLSPEERHEIRRLRKEEMRYTEHQAKFFEDLHRNKHQHGRNHARHERWKHHHAHKKHLHDDTAISTDAPQADKTAPLRQGHP